MADYGHHLEFGFFLTPDSANSDTVVQLARFADRLGLDFLGVQDHPYQPRFLDMWTLLSVMAGQTERIRLLPDVATLPLRPPGVLAGAAASLDILSGGRVELGLGSGAFPRATRSIGGPERTPREAVDALAEAIAVIRALWTPGPPVTLTGTYYGLLKAQPGPIPPHSIGIWLGAYKSRMLRLTGRLADGWIPTLSYAAPEELGSMTRIIDQAASDAGRDPSTVRRVYNISGRFSTLERGYLDGPPELWIAQLTELVLEHGMSAFLLAPGEDAVGDLERFAVEVAPGVREAVAADRQGASPTPNRQRVVSEEQASESTAAFREDVAPISPLLDETARPHVRHSDDGPSTPSGAASQQTLLQVHNHLRQELSEIQGAAAQVADGRLSPAAARSLINRMTVRENYWTLGAFCAQYCRIVTVHHTIEDSHMFPALRREDEALSAVLDRLKDEHEIIAEVVERFDRSLVALIEDPSVIADVRKLANELGDALLSHLAYEEDELLGPLGRSHILV
jgi:hemerythrin-like domain-containing protein